MTETVRLTGQGLEQLLGAAAGATGGLVAPVTEDGQVLFRPVREARRFDYINAVTPPKDFWFPQTERLFKFKTVPAVALEQAAGPAQRVVFGVRPCDLKSLVILDAVMATGEFEDDYYAQQRAATTVIGVACAVAGPHCFCTAMGVTPGDEAGADLMLYPDGDGFLGRAVTGRGAALIAAHAGCFAAADPAAVAAAAAAARKLVPALAGRLDVEGLRERFADNWDSHIWGEAAQRCLGCGLCTYLCPTCYCFGVSDEVRQGQGVRMRCWDSCMFSDFVRMAGGHNPRLGKLERVRQRFLHKLRYFPARHAELACTGCGRCVAKCPVGVHVPELIMLDREAR